MRLAVNESLVNECITELQKLIRIPSVKSEPDLHQPFGKPIDDALTSFLTLAAQLGLSSRNLDGYMGIIEMGEGEEVLGVLVHLDVVPADDINQWTHPPFSGHIEDERIWGRGTLDDKGPAMAVLYAMKLLNTLNISWDKRIKLIVGTDEESTWEDIEYYKQRELNPTMAFTPDGYFPITTSEKGILTLGFEHSIDHLSVIKEFQAGNRFNSTPAEAKATIDNSHHNFNFEGLPECISIQSKEDSIITICAQGAAGHTSSPDQQKNPIALLLNYIATFLPNNDDFWKVIRFFKNHLEKTNGEGLNSRLRDEVSGELTISQAKLTYMEGQVEFVSNIRVPSSISLDTIIDRSETAILNSFFKVKTLERKEPIHLDADNPFCQDLMTTYNEYFNIQAKPMSISGGTYARAFPNTVAFGALIPGKPLNAHQPNENVELSVIKDWIHIYANAILRIASKGE